MLSKIKSLLGLAFVSLLLSVPAHAATLKIVGGKTSITFDETAIAALESFHIELKPLTGVVSGQTVTYPITGGTATRKTASIEHLGSLLSVFNDQGTSANLANFLINIDPNNTGGGFIGDVRANVTGISGAIPVLNVEAGASAGDPVNLRVNSILAGELSRLFSTEEKEVPDLTNVLLATAVTEPELQAVPVPASLPLLAAGFAGFALMARRKRKAA